MTVKTGKRLQARIFKEYYVDGVHSDDKVVMYVAKNWAAYKAWERQCYGGGLA